MKIVYGVNNKSLAQIYEDISREGKGRISFYMMVILACIIATLGLLTNSPGVIIGAMLISPLMSPIIASSLAITLGDGKLAKSSFRAELSGMALAIIVSVLLTTFSPSHEITPEILAQTKPTLFHLLIALAAGFAGAYAICFRRGGGAILPGAAISISLMPPLSVTGIGLAMGELTIALGGFLLFLANLIAINLASSLVFYLAGFSSQFSLEKEVAKNVCKRLIISASLTLLISVPLFLIMCQVIEQNKINGTIQHVIADRLSDLKNANLVNYWFKEEKNIYQVNAIVRSPQMVDHELVKRVENSLEQHLGKPAKLNMQVVLVQEINPEDSLNLEVGVNQLLDKLKARVTQVSNEEPAGSEVNQEEVIEAVLKDKLKTLINAELLEFSFVYSSRQSTYEVKGLGEGETSLSSEDNKRIRFALENKLHRKVKLEVEIRHANKRS